MTINVKKILAESLIKLSSQISLQDITIQDLLNDSGVSRQTFYNHFLDKNDLIQYIYNYYIIPNFNDSYMDMCFYDSLLIAMNQMKKYHNFLKQACMMDGQNCLKDYIFHHCQEFDLKWHQSLYGDDVMSESLKLATIYHAYASSSMTLSWVLSDMPVSCEEMVKLIVQMRSIGMDVLFEGKKNPYK